MDNLYARAVFFVQDAEKSLAFYTQTLGFKSDWVYKHEERAWVFQVSLLGFELILNQVEEPTQGRAGHGRVFLGLDEAQTVALREHCGKFGIKTELTEWGNPTHVIRDLDSNELFFWLNEGSARPSVEQ